MKIFFRRDPTLVRKRQRGFTLLELMTVASILAAMSAMVVPSITGSAMTSRSTNQTTDLNSVRASIDQFKSETKSWPTEAALDSTSWKAGNLPTGSVTGAGTAEDPYIFSQLAVAGVDFSASGTVQGEAKAFSSNYFRVPPNYMFGPTSLLRVEANAMSAPFIILKGGKTTWIQLKNTTNNALNFKVWAVDKNAELWNFLDKDRY